MFLPFHVPTTKGSHCSCDSSRKDIASRATKMQKLLKLSMKSVWSDFFRGSKFCEPFMLSVELSQLIVKGKQA